MVGCVRAEAHPGPMVGESVDTTSPWYAVRGQSDAFEARAQSEAELLSVMKSAPGVHSLGQSNDGKVKRVVKIIMAIEETEGFGLE